MRKRSKNPKSRAQRLDVRDQNARTEVRPPPADMEALFHGALPGDQTDDIDLERAALMIMGEMLIKAVEVANAEGVKLRREGKAVISAATEMRWALEARHPEVAKCIRGRVLVAGDLPRQGGGTIRVVVCYPHEPRNEGRRVYLD